MCGRFTIVPTVDFHERFHLPPGSVIDPRYNVAPGQEVPVIVRGDMNRLVPMIWGFIAPFVKDPAAGRPVINARAESLLGKPSFRWAVQEGRCLVPASGFYEWRKEGRRKVPFYIRIPNEPIFSFAGISGTLSDPAGGEHRTFAIITTEPNRLVAGLHDRMPAILPREKEEAWLRAGTAGAADLESLLAPYPAGEMEAFPVAGRVNDPANDGPDLVRPLRGLTSPG